MTKYYLKRSKSESIHSQTSAPEGMSWAVSQQVTAEEIGSLSSRHNLDASAMHDVLDRHELPRVELSGDVMYVYLRTPQAVRRGEVISVPLLVVMNGSIFLTASVGNFDPPFKALDEKPLDESSSEPLLLATMAATVGEYENLIKKTARFIRDTGHRLRSHEATNKDFIYFVTIEDNLNLFQRDLSGMLAVTNRLKGDFGRPYSTSDHDALDDIALHIQQLLVSIASYTQSINSIRNAYSTVANNILNHRMKVLTTLTLLVALPNVFYGMYGMNVALPYAEQPWAFAGVVVFTIALILLVLLVAKRSRIL